MPPIVNCLKRASLKAALLEILLKSLKKRIPLLVTSNYLEKEQEKKRDYVPVFAPIRFSMKKNLGHAYPVHIPSVAKSPRCVALKSLMQSL